MGQEDGKKTVLLALIALSVLFSGCAAFQRPTYAYKDGTPMEGMRQQFSGDWAYCVAQGNQGSTGYTSDFGGQATQLGAFMNLRDACLQGKGWTRTN